MAKLTANGVEFYYEYHGDGPPLLLICGFTNHLGMWKTLLPQLASYFRVIVFDNRGSGRSSVSPPPYTIDQLADDAIALLDGLRISKAYMVGFSMGSLIIQSIALRYRNRIRKGVLIAPFSTLPSTAVMQMKSLSKLFQAGIEPALVLETLLPWIFSSIYLSDPKRVEETIQGLIDSPYPQPPEGYAGQLHAVLNCDMGPHLKNISTPLLILAGEEDVYIPFYEAEFMQKHLPNSVLKGIPKVGHMPQVEATSTMIEEIHAFCSD